MSPHHEARAGRRAFVCAALACCAALAACQALPGRQGLNEAQVALLQREGFQRTDEGWESSFGEKILFGTDADVLDPRGRAIVERLGRALLSVQIVRVRIEGHTDITGGAGYNDRLSLRRAQVVREALLQVGFTPAGTEARGLGDAHPVADNKTAEGRAENRRVAIVVAADQGP